MRPLEHVRVIELAEQVPASLCGKLLADAGATVIRVRTPDIVAVAPYYDEDEGRLASQLAARNCFLNASKTEVKLDLEQAGDIDAFDTLLAESALFLTSLNHPEAATRGIDCETLLARHPELTAACVSPFGNSGPYAHFHADDVVLSALSGLSDSTPGFPDRCPRPDDPPVQSRAVLAESGGAFLAAAAVFGALMPRLRGEDSPRHVEVAVLEAVVAQMAFEWGITAYGGGLSGRRTTHHALEPNVYLPCADGRVVIVAFSEPHWRAFVEIMGSPDWALAPEYATATSRGLHYGSLHANLRRWAGQQRGLDLLERAQARGVPCCCAFELAATVAGEQVAVMGSTEERDGKVFPADPVMVDGGRRPRRAASEDTGKTPTSRPLKPRPPAEDGGSAAQPAAAPLRGIRVLDLSQIVSGPYCGQLLAALGADVILVESARRLISRGFGPFVGEPAYDASSMFNQVNRGKRSVQINLASEGGRQLLSDLVAQADVVLENLSRRASHAMGITYDALREVRSDIILASISGFGRQGPWGDYVALHSGVILLSGLASVTRDQTGDMRLAGAIYPDLLTGTYMAFAIEQAVAQRSQTGRGFHIEVSMLDVMLTCMADMVPGAATGETFTPHPVHFLRAKEPDGFVAAPDASDAEAVSAASRQEAMVRLQHAGVPAAAVLNMSDVIDDPHLAVRGFVRKDDHPVAGPRAIPAVPWLYDGRRPELNHAPCLGDGTSVVLADLLGQSPDEIFELENAEVLV